MNTISRHRRVLEAMLLCVPFLAADAQRSATPTDRAARLFADRERVWHAWFANNATRLEQLLAPTVVAINDGDTAWQDRAAILATAREFARGGGKLVRLAFPRTETQVFGDVAILYSQYELEIEQGGRRSVRRGRATEVFVWRRGAWRNAGWHLDSGT